MKSTQSIYCASLCMLLLLNLNVCAPRTRSPQPQNDKPLVIAQRENHKYRLVVTFYGEEVTFGEGVSQRTEKMISYLTIRDEQKANEVRYVPPETGAEDNPHFYFTEVWSPDEEYLLLPLGNFQGFGVCKANEAMTAIKNRKFFDSIAVRVDSGANLWHEFGKWEGNTAFSFKAGLSGDLFGFRYDFASQKLFAPGANSSAGFIGRNQKGELKIISQ